jgi:hypothetical protein
MSSLILSNLSDPYPLSEYSLGLSNFPFTRKEIKGFNEGPQRSKFIL